MPVRLYFEKVEISQKNLNFRQLGINPDEYFRALVLIKNKDVQEIKLTDKFTLRKTQC